VRPLLLLLLLLLVLRHDKSRLEKLQSAFGR
jgi:hypothetical protein